MDEQRWTKSADDEHVLESQLANLYITIIRFQYSPSATNTNKAGHYRMMRHWALACRIFAPNRLSGMASAMMESRITTCVQNAAS